MFGSPHRTVQDDPKPVSKAQRSAWFDCMGLAHPNRVVLPVGKSHVPSKQKENFAQGHC